MTEHQVALAKTYAPAEVEARWYSFWEDHGLFHAVVNPLKPAYPIVIPPPNVTGVLHMGHILNNTLQDAYIRYKRMTGFEACWIPGTDHAGIATQHVVERSLSAQGMTRHDLGREKFIERVWEWKRQYGGMIIKQLRTLGASCDWAREKFTMDDTLSSAVREVFVTLYEQGLIYRGKYVVNWCPRDHTAISDDEVNYTEQQGSLWYIRYPLRDDGAFAIVATTRPETMLGDTAIAVNPKDQRYAHLVGRMAVLPLTGREIPIVADDFVDPAFGTGMVKVTPAHDPNDYWIGQRHNLPQINIFDVSARLNESVPAPYRGLDRFEARKRIVADLEALGLLEKAEDYTNSIGRCYRCDTIIEPYLSDQWFVRMAPLAAPALEAVMNGTVRLHPERWSKVYQHWMENIRDWCISRQLWWGHRIPVWYCTGGGSRTGCSGPIVSRTAPDRCPNCGGASLRQDDDVLDTWFSSWLWPFSVHDWPGQKETGKEADLRFFYPTELLVTAPDIIFFWVARMIMANMEFMRGEPNDQGTPRTKDEELIPFQDVYFTSIIRDAQGRKMSKSLGNSPDPLDVIDQYGADALRFTVAFLSPLGQDVLFSSEKCEIGRNFANKIWNAGRFLLMNKTELVGSGEVDLTSLPDAQLDLADRWILSRLHHSIGNLNTALTEFRLNEASKILYDFIWHDFCDWYLELVKTRFYGDESAETKKVVLTRALWIFDQALRLLHPVMPFVTEELWQHLAERSGQSLIRSAFPAAEGTWVDQKTEDEMAFVQDIINALRNIRGENNIAPSKEIKIQVRLAEGTSSTIFDTYSKYLQKLARVSAIEMLPASVKPKLASGAVVGGSEIFVPLEGLIDLDAERARIEKEIARLQQAIEATERKLANESFVARAPQDVVEKEREKLASFRTTVEKLQANLIHLS